MTEQTNHNLIQVIDAIQEKINNYREKDDFDNLFYTLERCYLRIAPQWHRLFSETTSEENDYEEKFLTRTARLMILLFSLGRLEDAQALYEHHFSDFSLEELVRMLRIEPYSEPVDPDAEIITKNLCTFLVSADRAKLRDYLVKKDDHQLINPLSRLQVLFYDSNYDDILDTSFSDLNTLEEMVVDQKNQLRRIGDDGEDFPTEPYSVTRHLIDVYHDLIEFNFGVIVTFLIHNNQTKPISNRTLKNHLEQLLSNLGQCIHLKIESTIKIYIDTSKSPHEYYQSSPLNFVIKELQQIKNRLYSDLRSFLPFVFQIDLSGFNKSLSDLCDGLSEELKKEDINQANINDLLENFAKTMLEQFNVPEEPINEANLATLSEEKLRLAYYLQKNSMERQTNEIFDLDRRVEYMLDPARVSERTELHVLRRWGSTTGIYEHNKDFRGLYGGGFFLNHRGYGLVIDPGHSFLRSYCKKTRFGYKGIHALIISHAHLDHSDEARRISTLYREISRNTGQSLRIFTSDPKDAIIPEIFNEGEHLIIEELVEGQEIIVTDDEGNPLLSIASKKVKHKVGKYAKYKKIAEENGEDIFTRKMKPVDYAYAFVLTLFDPGTEKKVRCKIGFTGDMDFYQMDDQDVKSVIEFLKDCDVLTANLSSTSLKELVTPGRLRDDGHRHAHLKIEGTLQMIDQTNCKLYLINELWEPLGGELDYRPAMIQYLCSRFPGESKPVFFCELGAIVRFEEGQPKIFCSPLCGDSGCVSPDNIEQLKISDSKFEAPYFCCARCREFKARLFSRNLN